MRKKYVRVGFTPAQKAERWERWRRGEQMKSFGRVFGKPSSSIFKHIRSTGGYTPVERKRAPSALTLAEREEVSRGLVAGQTIRAIARTLGRAPSTISREIRRNGGQRRYRAALADSQAKDALLRELDITLFALAGLRLVAWNIMLARGPRDEWLAALVASFRVMQVVLPAPRIARIAAIDSS